MAARKVGVREFRERITSFLESDTPVASLGGVTLGVYAAQDRRNDTCDPGRAAQARCFF